jgi:biopolymer transport protein ExbB
MHSIPVALTSISELINRLFAKMEAITYFLGDVTYVALGICALWGLFCCVVIWMRIKNARFRSEDAQNKFLGEVEMALARGDFEGATVLCESDDRVVAQLALLAISQRDLGHARLRQVVVDRFQRDFLADLDHRMSWVNTCIKSAPMLGLLGTVLGMMSAFAKLAGAGAGGSNVDPAHLASDISLALITTMMGLSIAIPLIVAVASINVRMRKLEDMVGAGLTRLFESLKNSAAAR